MAKQKRIKKKEEAIPHIQAESPFRDANFVTPGGRKVPRFSGETVEEGSQIARSASRQPREEESEMRDDEPSYVVRSYDTPVAWKGKRGWQVTRQKYSRTTTLHLGVIRGALGGHFLEGHDNARDQKEEQKLWKS